MKFKDEELWSRKTYEIEPVELDVSGTEPVMWFVLRTIDPDNGAMRFRAQDVRQNRGLLGIEFGKSTEISKKLTQGKTSVFFCLSQEAADFVRKITEEEIRAFSERAMQKEVAEWEYAFGGDSWKLYLRPVGLTLAEEKVRPDVTAILRFCEKNRDVIRWLEEHGTRVERDSGLYTRDGWWKVSTAELMEAVAQAKAKIEEAQAKIEEEFDRALRIARSTGKDVKVRSWTEPCNDPREDCDIDEVVEYVRPDGTRCQKRHHTW